MNMNIKRNVVAGALAALLLSGGTAWAISANQPAETLVASGEVVEVQAVSPRAETSEHREAPVGIEPTVEPVAPAPAAPAPVEPAPVAPAPVAPAPAEQAPAPAPAPALGMAVPWVPQEGNSDGGYWDTQACPSATASVASDGVVRCDP